MVARRCVAAAALTLVALSATAAQPALVRLERVQGLERNQLLDAGLPLVAEMNECFLALGDPASMTAQAVAVGVPVTVIDRDVDGYSFAQIGLRSGTPASSVAACGRVVWSEETWLLVKAERLEPQQCTGQGWFFRPLALSGLGRTEPPPAGYGAGQRLVAKPMVQDMVDSLTEERILGHWEDIVNVASTRLSESTGCQTAAESVYALFQALDLNPQYQDHTAGHAPNVIGTITARPPRRTSTSPSAIWTTYPGRDPRRAPTTTPAAPRWSPPWRTSCPATSSPTRSSSWSLPERSTASTAASTTPTTTRPATASRRCSTAT